MLEDPTARISTWLTPSPRTPANSARHRSSTSSSTASNSPPAAALGVVVRNLVAGRRPVYALGEWATPYDPAVLGLSRDDVGLLNDRVGQALSRLFDADRASLLTCSTSQPASTPSPPNPGAPKRTREVRNARLNGTTTRSPTWRSPTSEPTRQQCPWVRDRGCRTVSTITSRFPCQTSAFM